jgi:hypothetical protein
VSTSQSGGEATRLSKGPAFKGPHSTTETADLESNRPDGRSVSQRR